jgi:hypothetical protein
MPDLDRAGERSTLIQQPQPQPQRMARRASVISRAGTARRGEQAGGEFRQQFALAGGVEVGDGQRLTPTGPLDLPTVVVDVDFADA